MDSLVHNITNDTGMFAIAMIFGFGGIIAILAIFFGSLTSVSRTKEREKSRREIAAYIAEGSMSPEDGERLMNAGEGVKKCG